MLEKYKTIFQIPDEIEIQLVNVEGKQELTYIPEQKKAIIHLDPKFPQDLAELIAQLKLGIEYHPLLATFYFQPNLTKEEEIFASSFYTAVVPVVDAWVYKTMKEYLPTEELEKQLEELQTLWERLELEKLYTGNTEPEADRRRHSFSMYLIFKILGYPAQLKLIGKGKQLQEWIRYKKTLEWAIQQTPSPEILTQIPEKTKAPYKVSVKDKYYEIKVTSSRL